MSHKCEFAFDCIYAGRCRHAKMHMYNASCEVGDYPECSGKKCGESFVLEEVNIDLLVRDMSAFSSSTGEIRLAVVDIVCRTVYELLQRKGTRMPEFFEKDG